MKLQSTEALMAVLPVTRKWNLRRIALFTCKNASKRPSLTIMHAL